MKFESHSLASLSGNDSLSTGIAVAAECFWWDILLQR